MPVVRLSRNFLNINHYENINSEFRTAVRNGLNQNRRSLFQYQVAPILTI